MIHIKNPCQELLNYLSSLVDKTKPISEMYTIYSCLVGERPQGLHVG